VPLIDVEDLEICNGFGYGEHVLRVLHLIGLV
jgi:hypothetical protein